MKLKGIIAFFIMTLCCLTMSSAANPPSILQAPRGFTDIDETHWAYNVVMNMSERKLVSGYNDGSFQPDKKVTRAEFAAMLTNALKLEKNDNAFYFKDLENHWAKDYVAIVSRYLTGYKVNGEFYFRPDDLAVREDMAVAVVTALGLENENADRSILNSFSDKDEISDNFEKYIAIAVENKIMKGNINGTFNPKGGLTRAEMTQIMYNILPEEEEGMPEFKLTKINEGGEIDLGENYSKYQVKYERWDGYKSAWITPFTRYLREKEDTGNLGWDNETVKVTIRYRDEEKNIKIRNGMPDVEIDKVAGKIKIDKPGKYEIEIRRFDVDSKVEHINAMSDFYFLDQYSYIIIREKATDSLLPSIGSRINGYTEKVRDISEVMYDDNGTAYRILTRVVGNGFSGGEDTCCIVCKDSLDKYASFDSDGRSLFDDEFGIKKDDLYIKYSVRSEYSWRDDSNYKLVIDGIHYAPTYITELFLLERALYDEEKVVIGEVEGTVYNVEVIADNANVYGEGEYKPGEKVNIEVVVKDGYKFMHIHQISGPPGISGITQKENGNKINISFAMPENDVEMALAIFAESNSANKPYQEKYEKIDAMYHYIIDICSCGEINNKRKLEHVFVNNKCKYCEYEKAHTCVADVVNYEKVDATYHNVIKVCDCGKTVGTPPKEKHTFSNNKCKYCEYEKVEAHKCTIGTKKDYEKIDENQHKILRYCDCGKVVNDTTKEKHTYTNGKCKCGDEIDTNISSNHKCEYNVKEYFDITDEKHSSITKCVCGKAKSGSAFTVVHHYTYDGKCVCGKEKPHECSISSEIYTDITATTHRVERKCECGNEFSPLKQNHKYTNNVCVCGYEKPHKCTSSKTEYEKIDEDKHYIIKKCECGEIMSKTEKNHSYEDEKCICGALKSDHHYCKSAKTEYRRHEKYDKREHIVVKLCECGEETTSFTRRHNFENGKCVCGITEEEGTHICELAEIKYEKIDDKKHKVIQICKYGEKMKESTSLHMIVDEKCTNCDYQQEHVCKSDEKKYEEVNDEKHIVISICKCGKTISEREVSHSYKNGECVCGAEKETASSTSNKNHTCSPKTYEYTDITEKTHKSIRKCECGKEMSERDEVHRYKDGKCISCGYER